MQTLNRTEKCTTTLFGRLYLMHDAIATLFLGTLQIKTTKDDVLYHRRLRSGRLVSSPRIGCIGLFEHPLLPLLGTVLIHAVFQIISIVQQSGFKLHSSSPEIAALLEMTGGSCTENPLNVAVEDMPVVCSLIHVTTQSEDSVWHIGYLPERIAAHMRQYASAKQKIDAPLKFVFVDKE